MEMTSSHNNYVPKKNICDNGDFDDFCFVSCPEDIGRSEGDQVDTMISSQDSCKVKSILIQHSPLNE